MNADYIKSDLCTGFDSRVSCIACCQIGPCGGDIIPFFDKFYVDLSSFIDINPKTQTISYKIGDKMIKENGWVINLNNWKVNEKKPLNFSQSSNEFKNVLKKNTNSFCKRIKEQSLDEIAIREVYSEGGNHHFLGNVNGRIGCLFYPYENPKKNIFYRPYYCPEYLCWVAEGMGPEYFHKNIHKIMKNFVNENKKNKKLNSLNYSRIIDLIHDHSCVFEFLEFDFDSKSLKKHVEDLNKLVDFISK